MNFQKRSPTLDEREQGYLLSVSGPGQRLGEHEEERWGRKTSLGGVQLANLQYSCSTCLHLFFSFGKVKKMFARGFLLFTALNGGFNLANQW